MKLDKSSVNSILFVVLLVFTFEFALACLSNLSIILFIPIGTAWYKYVSLIVILGLSLFLFVFLYKSLFSVKRRNLFLLLLCVVLMVTNFWLSDFSARKMIDMKTGLLVRYSEYRTGIFYLRLAGKYVLIFFLLVLKWVETVKERNVQSDEIEWED